MLLALLLIFSGVSCSSELPLSDSPELRQTVEAMSRRAVRMNGETLDPKVLGKLRESGIEMTVTIFGSARIRPPEQAKTPQEIRMSRYYEEAVRFAALTAERGGGRIAIATGGGPGIMEAGNRGASQAGAPTIGFNIRLPHEKGGNSYITPGLSFDFVNFAARKAHLRHRSVGLVFFPGGFGTCDELFEVLTLMQTGKMPRAPIVLFGGRSYWSTIFNFQGFVEAGLISEKDLALLHDAETAEEAWDAIAGSLRSSEAPAGRSGQIKAGGQ